MRLLLMVTANKSRLKSLKETYNVRYDSRSDSILSGIKTITIKMNKLFWDVFMCKSPFYWSDAWLLICIHRLVLFSLNWKVFNFLSTIQESLLCWFHYSWLQWEKNGSQSALNVVYLYCWFYYVSYNTVCFRNDFL